MQLFAIAHSQNDKYGPLKHGDVVPVEALRAAQEEADKAAAQATAEAQPPQTVIPPVV